MKGITLSPEEIQALQEHGKVTIWRVIKPQPYNGLEFKGMIFNWKGKAQAEFEAPATFKDGTGHFPYGTWMYHPLCPYGQVGDKLWAKETWCAECHDPDTMSPNEIEVCYKAGYNIEESDYVNCRLWKPSIHMPRWASRFDLEVMEVQVEHGESWRWVLELKKLEREVSND